MIVLRFIIEHDIVNTFIVIHLIFKQIIRVVIYKLTLELGYNPKTIKD